jgi:hypothetical protein
MFRLLTKTSHSMVYTPKCGITMAPLFPFIIKYPVLHLPMLVYVAAVNRHHRSNNILPLPGGFNRFY